jgi:hypothetical protein
MKHIAMKMDLRVSGAHARAARIPMVRTHTAPFRQ